MDKPEKETAESYDYSQCEKWVAKKLGIRDLRDVANRFGPKPNKDAEYQDFWHFLIDSQEIHNGCFIHIDTHYLEESPDWVKPILKMFAQEFGETTQYWVSW